MKIGRVDSQYLLPLVIALLIPLMMQYHGGTDYLALSLSGIISTFLSWFVIYIQVKRRDTLAIPKPASPLGLFLLFFIWSSISIIWSIDLTVSWIGISWLFFFINGYLIATYLSRQSWLILLRFMVVVAVFIAILTLYQSYIENPIGGSVGLLRNPNTNSAFLTLLITLFTGVSLSTKKIKPIELAVLAVLSLAVSSIGSRGSLLVLIISFIFFYWAVRKRKSRHRKFIWITSVVTISLIINPNMLIQGIDTIVYGSGTIARLQLWQSTWQIFLDNPYLGTGFATFMTIYPRYRNPLETSAGSYAHNDYLQYLAELGPVGFILFAWFIFVLLRKFPWRRISYISFSKLGVWLALGGILVHTAVTFHLYQVVMLFLVGLFVGYLSRDEVTLLHQFSSVGGVIKVKFVAYSLALVSIMMLGTYATFWISNSYIGKSHQSIDQVDKLRALEQAYFWAPYYSRPKMLIARALLNGYIGTGKERGEQLYSVLMELLDNIDSNSSIRCKSFLMRAQAFIEHGDPHQQIITSFQRAVNCDPYNLISRIAFYDYLMGKGERGYAHSVIEGGVGRTVTRSKVYISFLERLAAKRREAGESSYSDVEHFMDYLQSSYRMDDKTIYAFTYSDDITD